MAGSRRLIRLCRWLWGKRSLFWGTFIFSVLLNIVAALLFFRWPWSINPKVAEDGSFVKWVLQHPGTFLLCGIILLLLTSIVGLANRLDGGLSERELKRRYLLRMIRETELLSLTGIPDGLVA